MKTFVRCTSTLIALLLLSSSALYAQQTVLTGDTQINSAATTTNYAKSTTLQVGGGYSTLLLFDISSLLPTGTTPSQVEHANLVIFPDSVTTPGTIAVDRVTSTWGESAVTYANKPTTTTTGAATATINTADKYVQISLTGIVQSWIGNPSGNYGVELFANGGTNFLMDSKENTSTGHNALLLITLSSPAGPAGPAGATGPQGPAGGGLASVSHNSSFTGSGSSSSPLALSSAVTIPGTLTTTDTITTTSSSANGFYAATSNAVGNGIYADGSGTFGYGVYATGYYGIYAEGTGKAGYFDGDVYVGGTLSKAGGSFKIDHPLDPENKYLSHSFVESPDMMNIYNGNVVTDASGTAIVTMPDYFDALNRDFRYQLTVVGEQFAQARVASKMANRSFIIRTDKPNIEVSWQVTGIRQDAWANAHRIPVEEDKPEKERGLYLHPELYQQPIEKSEVWALRPEMTRKMAEQSKPQ